MVTFYKFLELMPYYYGVLLMIATVGIHLYTYFYGEYYHNGGKDHE